MRIYFGYDYALSGTESVLMAFAEALRGMGHEVTTKIIWGDKDLVSNPPSLKNYDLAHFWNLRSAGVFVDTPQMPSWGLTAHGFGASGVLQRGIQDYYIAKFKDLSPDWIHVMDTFTLQVLGREGLYSFYTPQVITQVGFESQPPPTAMNLMSLGADSDGFKRFHVVKDMARYLGVPAQLYDSSELVQGKDFVRSFYKSGGIFVNACFGACGPVPPQEALLCGRPVLTTRMDTMNHLIKEGVNGEFFDGSAIDGARKAKLILDNYPQYHLGACTTKLFDPTPAAQQFLEEACARIR